MTALLRFLGRCAVAVLACACVLLIAVQYYHVLAHTVALAHELTATKREIADLSALRTRQTGEIRRLSDPRGAIPEIHDRLRLIGRGETLIYVEGAANAASSPAP